MDTTRRAAAEMTAAMAILGTIGWFVLVSGQSALQVVFWRCAFGAVTLLIICAALGLFRTRIGWRTLGLAALGGVAIVLNWVLLFSAYKHASIAVATVVYNVQPFILVLFGVLVFKERPTVSKLAWLALAFGGVVLIVLAKPATSTEGDYLLGIVLALCAALGWAIAAVITKRLAGTPPHLIALVQVVVGTLMLAPFAELQVLPSAAGTWAVLVTLGVVHTGLVYILMYGAIQKLATHVQGALSFVYPVVAILVDVVAFGRTIQPIQIVGAVAVLLAAAGTTLGWSWRPARQEATAKP